MTTRESRPAGDGAASGRPGGPSADSTAQDRQCPCWQATAWRLLNSSPHLIELIEEWVEWSRRKTLRETSWAISGGLDWRKAAETPSYAELERRRRLTSVHPCGVCDTDVEIVHPMPTWQFDRLPDVSWVRCDAHREVAA